VDVWKDAIFVYESGAVPDELKVVEQITSSFKKLPEAQTTLVQVCHGLDAAAVCIDGFKAKTCGSAYSLAVINLNMFGTRDEFNFLMQPSVLGDPRIIFVASLKSMTGECYTFAKNKVNREGETQFGAPSCIDCYASNNREEAADRLAKLMVAYLHEGEQRLQAKRSGTQILLDSEALQQLRTSTTTYYGSRGRSTGVFRSMGGPAAKS
jgi:hypothetical protein